MKDTRRRRGLTVVQLGAGLVGRHLGLLVASIPEIAAARVIDRDVYSKTQAWDPADVGRPKAQVLAWIRQRVNRGLEVDAVVADIENLPLGLFRCDVLLTALDSKRARMVANYAYGKLGIRYWIDSGVCAPSLVRVSVFARGANTPCYECALDDADYASDQSYPCQQEFTPPPTNSPEHLGALAASLQAAECARLVTGQTDQALLSRELIYDVTYHKLCVTQLVKRNTCRFDHRPFAIRQLRQGPHQISVAGAFALGSGPSNHGTAATLEVPGKLFVRQLACLCGERRQVLRLKGRFQPAELTCGKCRRRMTPLGTGLSDTLARETLKPAELARSLTALGLQPADVLGIGKPGRVTYFELGSG